MLVQGAAGTNGLKTARAKRQGKLNWGPSGCQVMSSDFLEA